ncbi:MAG TPA: metallophosphoesterase [Oceanipulchritudo sp.]|nr:metallophosphoesterase [Oceanipulchritudo sp.]
MACKTTADAFPERWDASWIEQRIRKESGRIGYSGQGRPATVIPMPLHYRLLSWTLKTVGLFPRGYRNFLDIRVRKLRHEVPGWPASLDGYRILQIADPHIDLDPGLLSPLCGILNGLEAELVVFTGDFWEGSNASYGEALAGMRAIVESLPLPRDGFFGVPGNHDPAALCASLEALGIEILINEARTIGAGSAVFALAGVDDPYHFQMQDIQRAALQCPHGLARILLSHSPQVAEAATEAGFDLMFSGHTHGGQICLPGGRPLVSMPGIPRPLFAGSWRCGALRGYTSTGAGACHVPVRYNCPPEVVLHSLHPSP